MARPIRILLTGVGAPGTRGTLYALRHNPDRRPVHVVGVDARTEAVGRHFVEGFQRVPLPEDPAYGDALLALCARERVELIVPQTTRETVALARLKDGFGAAGVRVMVADPGAVDRDNDKGRLLELFEELGLPQPAYRVATSEAELAMPLIRIP